MIVSGIIIKYGVSLVNICCCLPWRYYNKLTTLSSCCSVKIDYEIKNKSFFIEILIRKLKNKGGQMRHPLKHQDTESLGKGN